MNSTLPAGRNNQTEKQMWVTPVLYDLATSDTHSRGQVAVHEHTSTTYPGTPGRTNIFHYYGPNSN